MDRVAIDTRDEAHYAEDSGPHTLTESLATAEMAIAHYRIAPGDGFPGGLHAHMDQEEMYLVTEGEATVETLEGTETVTAGEAVSFDCGEFHTGWNEGDTDLVALALGVPRGTEDIRLPAACPACECDTLRLAWGGGATTFVCPDCEIEHIPAPCPECGHDDLQFTRESGQTVALCQGCGGSFDEPPLKG